MICKTCNKESEIIKKEVDKFGKSICYFSCGHKIFQVHLQDSAKGLGLLKIKKKGSKDFSKEYKFDYEAIVGERVGIDGKVAFIEQIIDRVKNYYKKFVKQGNKIIKDVEEKLTNHHRPC